MFCRVCNSRVPPGGTACPNCGSHSIVRQETGAGASAKLPPAVINDDPDDPVRPGHPEAAGEGEIMDRTHADEPVEVELNQPADLGPADSDAESKEILPESSLGDDIARGTFVAPLDAAGLRSMLVEQPDMLEAGLRLFSNEKGIPLGAGYTTAVGEIHLLARDADDGFVVVMVAEDDSAEQIVSGVLQRIGWVRRHLSTGNTGVRGIVLLDGEREDITYAASAVSDTVSFRTYRIAVCFDDLRF